VLELKYGLALGAPHNKSYLSFKSVRIFAVTMFGD